MGGFGVAGSERRAGFATGVPERDKLEKVSLHPIVEKVANTAEVEPTDNIGASRFDFGAYAGLFNEQSQRSLNILANSANGSGPIFGPPFRCPFDFPLRAGFDSDAECQDQPKRRSRAKSSSAEMPSSRSASSRASRSSVSCSIGSRTAASSPRARTVTDVPSGSERPSTTTLPPTIVPEAICIGKWYSTECEKCNLTPDEKLRDAEPTCWQTRRDRRESLVRDWCDGAMGRVRSHS